jgi:DNA-binding MarR family transcriptional regulator
VHLTAKGRAQFESMAAEHEGWILELFSCFDAKALGQMYTQLGALRVHQMAQADSPNPSKE